MAEQKTAGKNFILKSVPQEWSAGRRRKEAAVDALFVFLFTAGAGGGVLSLFGVTAHSAALLTAAVILAFLAWLLFAGKKKGAARRGVLLWAAVLAASAAILFLTGVFRDGWNLVLNQAVDTLGNHFPYPFPEYAVSAPESRRLLLRTAALLWAEGLLALCGVYLARWGNKILLGILLAGQLTAQAVLGFSPALFWNVCWAFSLTALWIRGHGEKAGGGRQRLALFTSALYLALSALLVFGVIQIFRPFSGYEKNAAVSRAAGSIREALENWRFGGGSLPEGDFTDLGSLERSEDTALTVTMSSPESYYLRGFTGASYTGTGWEETGAEARWSGRALFYWLHEDGFYGQKQLALAAVSLDEEASEEEPNEIAVEVKGASRKYLYTPYELLGGEDLDLAGQKIGDEGALSGGFRGSGAYRYEALSNQVTKFPGLAAALADAEDLDEEGSRYAELEQYYNQFVYENYLEIPKNIKSELSGILGSYELSGEEKHLDYAGAKQNILYLLNAEYVYDEAAEPQNGGGDFLLNFLKYDKAGYSVHYATAAAMMFRYYGIPARYVEGYLITPADAEAMEAGEPYDVDETHAHAWVEYYQDGVGWLPFETTPSYLNIMGQAEEYQDISGYTSGMGNAGGAEEDTGEAEQPEEPEEEEPAEIDWLLVLEIVLAAAVCLAALLILAFFIWVFQQRRKSRRAKALFSGPDRRAAVRSLFSYTMNILAVAGLPIRNISLYRYGPRLEKMFDEETGKRFLKTVDIRQEAVYSLHEITEDQRAYLDSFKDEIWNRVYRGSGWFQRFQLKYIYFL